MVQCRDREYFSISRIHLLYHGNEISKITFVGKIKIGIYMVGAADELIRVDHFLPEDISVRYQVV